jgi:hypothetical protein
MVNSIFADCRLPAFDLGLISVFWEAAEILRGQLPGGGLFSGELLANEWVSGHGLLKRGRTTQAIVFDNMKAPRLEWRSGEPRCGAGVEARQISRFNRLLAAPYRRLKKAAG